MQENSGVTAVAHVIQLSVAPVFLLSGIGAMLSVMTSRLARVVDRARALERDFHEHGEEQSEYVRRELSILSRRSKLISRSITLCTVTALLVCSVIVVLFVSAFLEFDMSTTVALLFITAMAAFFSGLLLFLREILLATATVQIGFDHLPESMRPESKRNTVVSSPAATSPASEPAVGAPAVRAPGVTSPAATDQNR